MVFQLTMKVYLSGQKERKIVHLVVCELMESVVRFYTNVLWASL